MTGTTKRNVLGVLVDAVTPATATDRILDAAVRQRPFAVSALAVHGLISGVRDAELRHRLNRLDLVTADGQPVRWALNWLHGAGLEERVAGPQLMLDVCREAVRREVPVYLFGSRQEILDPLARNLRSSMAGIEIAGVRPSLFRQMTVAEEDELANDVNGSGAGVMFVGLGCPRQEVFAYEFRDRVACPVVSVGAAFDFHAGFLQRPSERVQRLGLEWAYRLFQEPRRLWRRYAVTNPQFMVLLAAQRARIWRPDPDSTRRPEHPLRYG